MLEKASAVYFCFSWISTRRGWLVTGREATSLAKNLPSCCAGHGRLMSQPPPPTWYPTFNAVNSRTLMSIQQFLTMTFLCISLTTNNLGHVSFTIHTPCWQSILSDFLVGFHFRLLIYKLAEFSVFFGEGGCRSCSRNGACQDFLMLFSDPCL